MSREPKGRELDRIVFRVKKEALFRNLFLSNFDVALREFQLNDEERKSLKDRDYELLARLGLKPELVIALAEIDKKTSP